jgi:uncharacterized protein YecT (DUF1311 family)
MRSPAALCALAIVAMTCSAAVVRAQPPANIDCAKTTTNPEIAWCAEQDLKAADAEMNKAYKAALERVAKADNLNTNQRKDWKRALQEAQRKWIAFRDADCGAPIGWEWYESTGMGTAVLACKIAKTEQRTKDLAARYGEK